MPKQGQAVESCIITEIKKKKGDRVKKSDILFTYETDKATFDEESPVDGVVLECFYDEGDEVPVLENMMVIGAPGEDYSDLIGAQETEESKPDETSNMDSNEKVENTDAPSVTKTNYTAKIDQPKFISPTSTIDLKMGLLCSS